MLSKRQKQSLAAMLAQNNLASVLARLESQRDTLGDSSVTEAITFAKRINAHYGKRDGFVPRKVIAIVNE